MEYVLMVIVTIVLYFLLAYTNPVTYKLIQKCAIVSYKDSFILTHSKHKIMKELIYNGNVDHLKLKNKNFENVYFYDRMGELKKYNGNEILDVSKKDKELIMKFYTKTSIFNIYNKIAMNLFVGPLFESDNEKA